MWTFRQLWWWTFIPQWMNVNLFWLYKWEEPQTDQFIVNKKNISVSDPQTAAQHREMTSAKLSFVGSSGGLEEDNLASCFTPNHINPPDKSSVPAKQWIAVLSHQGVLEWAHQEASKNEKWWENTCVSKHCGLFFESAGTDCWRMVCSSVDNPSLGIEIADDDYGFRMRWIIF